MTFISFIHRIIFFSCVLMTCGLIETNEYEQYLQMLEQLRLIDAVAQLKSRNITVAGFYHSSKWKSNWESIVTEQLRLMDGSRFKSNDFYTGNQCKECKYENDVSLLSIMNYMHVTISGSEEDFRIVSDAIDKLNLDHKDRIRIFYTPSIKRRAYIDATAEERKELRKIAEKENLTEGEFFTVNAAHSYCKQQKRKGEKTYVFYAHSKGECCGKGSGHPVADWRDEMNTFILEFPSTCMRALLAGYSTCGVEYIDARNDFDELNLEFSETCMRQLLKNTSNCVSIFKNAHYAGNFWWADCDHVAALPGLWDPIDNAYECESFIFNVSSIVTNNLELADLCGYTIFNCNKRHYFERCLREEYLPRIRQLLQSEVLLSPVSMIGDELREFSPQICASSRERPYKEQAGWSTYGYDWVQRKQVLL